MEATATGTQNNRRNAFFQTAMEYDNISDEENSGLVEEQKGGGLLP